MQVELMCVMYMWSERVCHISCWHTQISDTIIKIIIIITRYDAMLYAMLYHVVGGRVEIAVTDIRLLHQETPPQGSAGPCLRSKRRPRYLRPSYPLVLADQKNPIKCHR